MRLHNVFVIHNAAAIFAAIISPVRSQAPPLGNCRKKEHPPVDLETYYESIDDSLVGNELKTTLSSLIDGHKPYSYTPCVWYILQEADEHPDDSDSVLSIYSQKAIKKSNRDYGNNNPDSWNREHVWAKSHGFPRRAQDAYTDTHHLVAADRSCNTDRSDKDFRKGGDLVGGCSSARETSKTWEPPNEAKGEVARMMFYMATRYEGFDGDTPDLELIDGDSARGDTGRFGYLSDLLSWHCKFPVQPRERRRNDIVYSWQGNRNPFIDHPEYVERIWGSCNDDDDDSDGEDAPEVTDPEPSPGPPDGEGTVTREELIVSATGHLEALKRLPTTPESCAAYGCRLGYKPGQACQCNKMCERFKDCCDDYASVCNEGTSLGPVKILDLLADAKSHLDMLEEYAAALPTGVNSNEDIRDEL